MKWKKNCKLNQFRKLKYYIFNIDSLQKNLVTYI